MKKITAILTAIVFTLTMFATGVVFEEPAMASDALLSDAVYSFTVGDKSITTLSAVEAGQSVAVEINATGSADAAGVGVIVATAVYEDGELVALSYAADTLDAGENTISGGSVKVDNPSSETAYLRVFVWETNGYKPVLTRGVPAKGSVAKIAGVTYTGTLNDNIKGIDYDVDNTNHEVRINVLHRSVSALTSLSYPTIDISSLNIECVDNGTSSTEATSAEYGSGLTYTVASDDEKTSEAYTVVFEKAVLIGMESFEEDASNDVGSWSKTLTTDTAYTSTKAEDGNAYQNVKVDSAIDIGTSNPGYKLTDYSFRSTSSITGIYSSLADRYTLEMDVRINSMTADTVSKGIFIKIPSWGSNAAGMLFNNTTGSKDPDYGVWRIRRTDSSGTTMKQAMQYGQWYTLKLVYEKLSDGTSQVDLFIDNEHVYRGTGTDTTSPAPNENPVFIRSYNCTYDMDYDNIKFTVEPS